MPTDDADVTAAVALDRVTKHEEVCAERYKGIQSRLNRMELGVVAVLAAIVGQAWIMYNNSHPAQMAVPAAVQTFERR